MNPWFGIITVILLLGGLMTGLCWFKRRFAPHPELVRKLLHIGMGLTTLTFPWLFDRLWPVLVLVGLTVPAMLLLRHSGRLKRQVGHIIDGVKRDSSWGEIYFPLGVAGVFILAEGDPLRFTIPILFLALADAVAALVGVRYGRTHYSTLEGTKSAEGSLAFFVIAFVSVYLPLLVLGNTDPVKTLLISLIMAMLLMLVEAVAWHGLDNIFIPIAAFLLLSVFLELGNGALIERLILTIVSLGLVLIWRTRANLQDNALLGVVLIGYLSWTLGDWHWFFVPFIVFVGHMMLTTGFLPGNPFKILPGRSSNLAASKACVASSPEYNVYAIISVASAGLFWLVMYRLQQQPAFYFPFVIAFAAQLAMIVLVALKHSNLRISAAFLLGISIACGWLLLVPYLFGERLTSSFVPYTLLALFGVGSAVLAFYYVQPVDETYPDTTERWLRQAGCAVFGSMAGLIPLVLM